MRNIIDAIITIIQRNDHSLTGNLLSKKDFSAGYYDLEAYLIHAFADTFDYGSDEVHEKWWKVFSYLGNSVNPPDMMLKGGDAIEVKKIVNNSVDLRRFSKVLLNSIYPKQMLKKDDPLLTYQCRKAETWDTKDIIYAVGVVRKHRLRHLCMVYGRDYCASDEIYNEQRHKIKEALKKLDNVRFPDNREFARVAELDPLNSTEVRVCGMWQMKNPWQVFDYIYTPTLSDFNFMCIINDEKWATLENREKLFELQKNNSKLKISDVRIKNPDNPEKWRGAKIITYYSPFKSEVF